MHPITPKKIMYAVRRSSLTSSNVQANMYTLILNQWLHIYFLWDRLHLTRKGSKLECVRNDLRFSSQNKKCRVLYEQTIAIIDEPRDSIGLV